MAKVSNPRKQFKYSIRIMGGLGLDPWLVQEVDHPEEDVEPVPHGDANYDVKTAGRVIIGNATISKISRTSGPDNFLVNWRKMCQDELSGGGQIPDVYKKTVIVEEYAEDGFTIINTSVWYGAWPTKVNVKSHSRVGSENTVESFELSVDAVDKY